jgi:hypothetical protein
MSSQKEWFVSLPVGCSDEIYRTSLGVSFVSSRAWGTDQRYNERLDKSRAKDFKRESKTARAATHFQCVAAIAGERWLWNEQD